MVAGFGINFDFLPIKPIFEKDKDQEKLSSTWRLDVLSEQKEFMKYTFSSHHPYSTTFIVFSMKNA